MTNDGTSQKPARGERVMLQVPITEAERRRLKHRAIDEGTTLGEIVRVALGFTPTIESTEGDTM